MTKLMCRNTNDNICIQLIACCFILNIDGFNLVVRQIKSGGTSVNLSVRTMRYAKY